MKAGGEGLYSRQQRSPHESQQGTLISPAGQNNPSCSWSNATRGVENMAMSGNTMFGYGPPQHSELPARSFSFSEFGDAARSMLPLGQHGGLAGQYPSSHGQPPGLPSGHL